ncbi:ABC transporter permease [Paenibacillus beijingensis]|uniref:ABC3 transporter permease C-terminal domain-containing protein n=1 Tax=Paenibacillus beijingensis TaxID=1126833 RepID=A0A0D5NQZ1_9BACL|nr:ABC transporter permease [Paenibacillus beijingensis]AJY77656.1 hypothetical protein VN24_10960 [Paenibacillus beijingensis]
MIRTNNGKTVSKLAIKSLKANRLRNVVIVSAVVLTTLLLTSVFTMALSINKSMERAKMKTAGSDFHGSFKYLTSEEAEKLIRHPSVKEYGKTVLVGNAIGDAFKSAPLEISQIDSSIAKHSFVNFVEGGLPDGENEIATSTWILDLLGVPHETGATFSLDIDIDGKAVSKEFVLSGFFEADQYVAMSGQAFVSEAFVWNYVSHIDPEQSKAHGTYVNTTRLDVMFNNSFGIEKKIRNVLSDTGLDAPYGVNWAYASVSLFENPMNVIPYVALILIIMLSGYLLIYNIFHISVVRDIKFYGLLKTIGTTPRQVRKIISIQANRLYVAALPIGLASGYGIGRWVASLMTAVSSEAEPAYSASPIIFIGAALFSYMTLRVAASRPGRTAAKISPVEAVRYSGVSGGGGRKVKRSVNGAKLSRMSLGNLLRQKKKLLLMLASLSLSITLFSMIFTVISSLDMNKYLNAFISGDFVVKAETDTRGRIDKSRSALTADVSRALGAIDGVEGVDNVYFKPDTFAVDDTIRAVLEPLAAAEDPNTPSFTSILKRGEIDLQLHGIDSGWYDVIQKSDIVAGTFDRKKFNSGDYALITEAILGGDDYISYYKPGDKIKPDGMEKSYEVMAVLKVEALYAAGTKHYNTAGYKVFFPAAEFRTAFKNPLILSATLHADPAKLDQVENAAKAITDSNNGLTMKSREDYKKELDGFIRIFQTVGYGLSFIVALIGVLNYMNTVITGVITRRNEFAVLESIGMTRKQMKKMLVYEGLYSVLFTTLIVGTAGLLLTYLVAKNIAENMAFTVFHMNVLPVAAVIPMLAIISYTVTVYAYRMLSKATIVERLREVE